MKKKLNETDIVNELRDASAYFRRPAAAEAEVEEASEPKPRKRTERTRKASKANTAPSAETTGADEREDPVQPTALEPPEPPAGATSPPLGSGERIEVIRKAVKQLGKESTFSRFTREEKDALGDVVYSYKRSGIRTSENEVIRIAVNWLLEDYRSDGQNSVLAKVLGKLNT
jgi:hypothetical protein